MSRPFAHHPCFRLTTLLLALGLVACSPTPPPAAPAPATPKSTAAAATTSAAKTAPAAAAPAAKDGARTPGSGASASGRRSSEAERERQRQTAAEMVPVETALVRRGPISAFLTFNTTLETEAMVDIYPQTTGQVEAILVEEGKVVREGDALLKIEDRELRVDMEESRANFEQLERNFARTQDLFARKLVNAQDFETQKNALELARLRYERARLRHAYTTVRAPFAGVVASREAQVGARVSANSRLFSLVKLDETVAKVFVPGRYLPVVAENQPAVVTSEFLPDRTFRGWVKRISPVIDPKSGTFKVTVGVRGERPGDLPPGLFVNVRIITDTRPEAVLIAKRAVVYEGGERYVFALVNDRVVKRKLAAGYEDPEHVEALSGFEVGTPVVVLGQSGLKDGSLARSVNQPVLTAPGAPVLPAAPAGNGGAATRP
ncbi:MAG: efflux RND transporter periplasmic adaptor subunit [Opitutaceae bacterium]